MVEPGGGATVKLKGGLNGVTNIKDGKYTKQWRVFTYVTNSHRIGLEQHHGRRFIVLEHQYGLRDVK